MIIADALKLSSTVVNNQAAGNQTLSPLDTVDLATLLFIQQTTAGSNIILPAPTNPHPRLLVAYNTGTVETQVNGNGLGVGGFNIFSWDGVAWSLLRGRVSTLAVNALNEAIPTASETGVGAVAGVSATVATEEGKRYLVAWDGTARTSVDARDNTLTLRANGAPISTIAVHMNVQTIHYCLRGSVVITNFSTGNQVFTVHRGTAETVTNLNDRFNLTILELV